MPKILLSNDDGIDAPGLSALYHSLKEIGDVIVAAPAVEQSGVGHAITMRSPLRMNKNSENGFENAYAITGTPVDCVKMALNFLLDETPDLVVSGVNKGSNAAINAFYSGTVAAAAEAGIMQIPAIAVSLASYTFDDFSIAADIAIKFAKKVLEEGLPDRTFLNINVPGLPCEEIKGVRITRMGKTQYRENFEERLDPGNKPYYWMRGNKVVLDPSEETDEVSLRQGYAVVTPLQCDWTEWKALDKMKKWNISL